MTIIKAGDINLEYYLEGSGPPLLMIMGFGGQASSWGEPILEQLRLHFTTIRFSNRGTGRSDVPTEQFSVREMADDAANLLGALGIPNSHVFAVSMGGMIAQEYVLAYPERVNGLVLGCTTSGARHGVAATPEVMAMLVPAPGLSREEQVRKAWPAICPPAFIESNRDFLEGMLASGLATPTPMDTIIRQMVAIQGFDSFDRLGSITASTLIIHGDLDVLVPPENGRILARKIPGAEFHWIRDAGHMFFWEKPREASALIAEFLSRVPATA
jgi:pimeloyl-ACP methyl ester carboxylesterase